MDLNQITSQNDSLPSTNNLLPSAASITNTLGPILLLSTILSVLLIIAYVFSVIRRYKVEKAILAMQKDIHEMNERQKSDTPSPSPQSLMPATKDQPAEPLA